MLHNTPRRALYLTFARAGSAKLVASMQANGVERIYTYNTGDFSMFSEVAVVAPTG